MNLSDWRKLLIKLSYALWVCLKIILLLVITLEALSFALMALQNYVLYGSVFSHVPVRYDPETLFLMVDSNPPSDYNRVSADPKLNRIVWMFGGSTVRCNAHWNRNNTLPALVAKFLNDKAAPNHFTVINFGENGFNSILESKYLQKTFAEKREVPDVVVFYDGANDCFQFVEHRQPDGHIGYRRLKGFVESYRMGWFGVFKPINAAIYASYTNEFIDRIRMLRDPVKHDSPTLEKMAELAVSRYDHLAKVTHCYNAEFVLIWQPMPWVERCKAGKRVQQAERTTFMDIAKFPDLKESVTTTYDKLESTLWDKPYFVSFRNALCKRSEGLFRPDGIHLNDQGNELMASVIGKLLIKKFPDRICPKKIEY